MNFFLKAGTSPVVEGDKGLAGGPQENKEVRSMWTIARALVYFALGLL